MVHSFESGDDAGGRVGQRFGNGSNYSLTILIKLLQLHERNAGESFDLTLTCGGKSVGTSGTLDELNAEKLGNVIGLMVNAERFMCFLSECTVGVLLKPNDASMYEGMLKLKDTELMRFDPNQDGGEAVEQNFPLHDGTRQVGSIALVLRAERIVSPEAPFDANEVIFCINDHKPSRVSDGKQDPVQRQLLTCEKCKGLRSPKLLDCPYKLIDGVLHHEEKSSTEQEIERIKEKVRGVVLDETIGHHVSCTPSPASSGKFCGICGALSVTGVTCVARPRNPEEMFHNIRVPQNQPVCVEILCPSKNIPEVEVHKASKRCCERCKACLDWLPDVCCCPKCGYTQRIMKKVLAAPSRFPNGSLDHGQPPPNGASLSVQGSNTMIASSQSCSICYACQARCVDCSNQIHQQATRSSTTSTTLPRRCKSTTFAASRTVKPALGQCPVGENRQKPTLEGQTVELERPSQGKRSQEMRNIYGAQRARNRKERQELSDGDGKGRVSTAQIRKNYTAFIRKVKRQNRNMYSYRFGKRHPGMVVGHRTCMKQDPLVPPHMGWRWDIGIPGLGRRHPGWRPGAVRKPIMQLMQHFLKCYPVDNLPVSRKKSKVVHTGDSHGEQDGCERQKATLHITKKHGEYSITMNPLKDSETLKTTGDPYLPCQPIKFKLAKDPQRTKLYLLRDVLKRKGFPLCGCKQLDDCDHCTPREKRLIGEEIRRTVKVLGLSTKTTIADVPSDSESELDVEFTPPSAILRPDMRRPDVVVAETQYNVQDFQLKPIVDRDGKGKAPGRHGTGDAGSKGIAGKTPKGGTAGTTKATGVAGAPKPKGAPDATTKKVRLSVTKASGGAPSKGGEQAGKGGKK